MGNGYCDDESVDTCITHLGRKFVRLLLVLGIEVFDVLLVDTHLFMILNCLFIWFFAYLIVQLMFWGEVGGVRGVSSYFD